jgi:serine/threonine-protein kinase
MKGPRLSLTTRIFLSSAAIVTLVLAITFVVTSRSATKAAEASMTRGLDATLKRVEELVGSERAQLASKALLYAESPEYRSNVENPKESGDYLDYTVTAAEQLGAQWAQLISREGVRLAKSDAPSAPADTLTDSPLVRSVLEGRTADGFGVAGDSTLIQIVAVPIFGGGRRVIGALMAAKYVSDSLARAIGSQTQSEVLFYALDQQDEPHLAAATEAMRRSSGPVLAAVTERLRADSGVQQAGSAADSAARDTLDRIELNGEHFVGRRAVLLSASGAPAGGFIALRSLDKELAATGYTQLRNTLLFAGGGGLVLALLIGGLTARQVVRPVTVLADATRRAAEGDYQAPILEGGSDEIGTLASAFRRLLADLKDKQALVDFLSASSQSGTRTQTASSAPTMKLPAGMGDITMLSPGQTFGTRYEIKSVLGVGGMGMVYKANDKELGEVLAIKTLKPDVAADSNALDRFKSEIKLARRIAHRNVVRTYDLGEIGGQYYITMEYVEGKSLKKLIEERGRLPASVVLPIAKQLCRALEVSHDEGVIHRDIKPQNMVVQGDGVLKVMDFGIARLASRPKEAGHTQAGMVVGTPEYMSPEQLLGDELDARADLYATGVVLYECLTGRLPITADTPITLIAKVLEEEPEPPRALHSDIPPALSELVMWALAKDRDKRPRSAAELHARLDQLA